MKEKGHEVFYKRELPESLDDYDLFIVPSSIVGYETEIDLIKNLSKAGKKIAVIGPVASSNPKLTLFLFV